MKQLIMLLAAGCLSSAVTNAQPEAVSLQKNISTLNQQESALKKEKSYEKKELSRLKNGQVSAGLKSQFYSDFGNVPVSKWTRSSYFDEVSFVKNGKPFTAFYDEDTKLVGTSSPSSVTALPAKAQQKIKKYYKGYSIRNVIFFDDNEQNETDMVLYDQQFDDADNYFAELQKGNKKIILQVSPGGDVSYFKSY